MVSISSVSNRFKKHMSPRLVATVLGVVGLSSNFTAQAECSDWTKSDGIPKHYKTLFKNYDYNRREKSNNAVLSEAKEVLALTPRGRKLLEIAEKNETEICFFMKPKVGGFQRLRTKTFVEGMFHYHDNRIVLIASAPLSVFIAARLSHELGHTTPEQKEIFDLLRSEKLPEEDEAALIALTENLAEREPGIVAHQYMMAYLEAQCPDSSKDIDTSKDKDSFNKCEHFSNTTSDMFFMASNKAGHGDLVELFLEHSYFKAKTTATDQDRRNLILATLLDKDKEHSFNRFKDLLKHVKMTRKNIQNRDDREDKPLNVPQFLASMAHESETDFNNIFTAFSQAYRFAHGGKPIQGPTMNGGHPVLKLEQYVAYLGRQGSNPIPRF